ncbi:MAG TPA: hypothetical protein VFA94_08230, partial [Acidimicrobiales bacterium]|nr:hypothetical protein [Acidimicrobiales bacterium]
SVAELVAIGHLMLTEQRYELSPAAEQAFCTYVERRQGQPDFANARSIRNAIERARLRQAARLVAAGAPVGAEELVRIEAEDLLMSRVFGHCTTV